MINLIKKLFSTNTNVIEKKKEIIANNPAPATQEKYNQKFSTEPYDFKTISLDDVLKKDTALYDLYTNATDGFLIKNFLSSEEVDQLMSHLQRVMNDKPAHTSVGFTYPPVFAEFSNQMRQQLPENKEKAVEAYFEKTTTFNHTFDKEYGVNVKERIENLFRTISGNRAIKVAPGIKSTVEYPFATYRYLVPDKGLMSVHCGNYFGKTFEEFYKDLTTKVAVENQMSFFIMLQEPEKGGELTLFNFRWKNGQTKSDPMEDNEIIQPDGSKMYVENDPNIIKDKVAPKKGDMILFQGGNIWHRVETVRGNIPRVTFGGFIGISIDKNTFYYWS